MLPPLLPGGWQTAKLLTKSLKPSEDQLLPTHTAAGTAIGNGTPPGSQRHGSGSHHHPPSLASVQEGVEGSRVYGRGNGGGGSFMSLSLSQGMGPDVDGQQQDQHR